MSDPKPNPRQAIAGDAALLARRYAGALYELASERNQVDVVAGDLRGLGKLLRESTEMRRIVEHPRLTRDQMAGVVKSVSASAQFQELTSNFLSLLARNRRLNVLGAIVDAFLDELGFRRGEFTADVRAARPLTAQQQEQLSVKLREIAGGKVHLSMTEDASLLGGITVKLGSRLYDASIKNRLARLERQLKSPTVMTQKGAA